MCLRWGGNFKRKDKRKDQRKDREILKGITKEALDKDLAEWKNGVVTGEPVNDTSEKKRSLIPISATTLHTEKIEEMVNSGGVTDGVLHATPTGPLLFYEFKDRMPKYPVEDVKGEYMWDRIPVNTLVEKQKEGWKARGMCPSQVNIWVCCRK